jgi:hypothetical protein
MFVISETVRGSPGNEKYVAFFGSTTSSQLVKKAVEAIKKMKIKVLARRMVEIELFFLSSCLI